VIEAVEGLLEHGNLLGGKIFILVKTKKLVFLSGNPLELEGSQVLTTLLMLLLVFLGCTCL